VYTALKQGVANPNPNPKPSLNPNGFYKTHKNNVCAITLWGGRKVWPSTALTLKQQQQQLQEQQ